MAWCIRGTSSPPYYTNVEFDGEDPPGGTDLGLTKGITLDPAVVPLPTSGYSEKRRKRMPEYIDRWSIQFVSDSFRRIVEELEPGVHQFFPFALRNGKRGEPTPEPYFVMNIRQVIECIDLDESFVSVSRFNNGEISFLSPRRPGQIGLKLKRDAITGRHLWRAKYYGSGFFISDELMKRFQKAKIRKLEEAQADEI